VTLSFEIIFVCNYFSTPTQHDSTFRNTSRSLLLMQLMCDKPSFPIDVGEIMGRIREACFPSNP